MQHRPWTGEALLSRGLARVERFLSHTGFDRGPWLVVAFGIGVIAWFWLPSPAWWTGLLTGCVAICAIACAPFPGRDVHPYLSRAILVLPLLVAAGCLTVWARSGIAGAEPIARPVSGTFTGRVLAVEPQPALGRDRLVLAMREPDTGRAIKVRVNVPVEVSDNAGLARPAVGQAYPARGDLVRFRGRLMPPAPPMLPGAYDFARTAWFTGLAASGSAIGKVTVVSTGGQDGGGRAGGGGLGAIRQGLSGHIAARIGSGHAGLASALVTGDRGAIAPADDAAMRDAGLAHLLSVSGLHVSAVVGAAYLLVLRVLALFPWLALRVRLPLVAAGAAAAVLYTLISGAEVPTVRSCIGALLVLGALALGREPLSLRMLAVAAFLVLLLWPEAVMGPSFQMSFGAVLALVAVTGSGWARRFMAPRDEMLPTRWLRHAAMLLVTGVVIDLALMPIGLYHFHRAGIYGALANVVAIPLTTFVVMPLLAGALALDLVGAGWPLWWLAGHAIEVLTGLAHWFASRPGAVSVLPASGTGAFMLFVAGGLWLGLWSGRVRWPGLPVALAGAAMLAFAPPPDLLVSGDGRHVALVAPEGDRLFVLRAGGEGYARDNLMELAGIEGQPLALASWPGARCNRDFCAVTVRRGTRDWNLLASRGRDAVPERALAAACERSDIVVSDRWLPRSCRPHWFKADRETLGRTGGLAVDMKAGTARTVAATQGAQGWWRPVSQGAGTLPDAPVMAAN